MAKVTLMQTTLQQSDFNKVTDFISTHSCSTIGKNPMVKELTPTKLYIGICLIEKVAETWQIRYNGNIIQMGSKRNAMYYAFLIAYKETKLLPALISIDNRLGSTRNDIVRFKYLINNTTESFKTGLYHNKLSEAVARYQKAKHDMHNWMDYAKYINS